MKMEKLYLLVIVVASILILDLMREAGYPI